MSMLFQLKFDGVVLQVSSSIPPLAWATSTI